MPRSLLRGYLLFGFQGLTPAMGGILKAQFSSIRCNLISRNVAKCVKSWVNVGQTRKQDESFLNQGVADKLSLALLTRKKSGKLPNRYDIIPITQKLECPSGFFVELDN